MSVLPSFLDLGTTTPCAGQHAVFFPPVVAKEGDEERRAREARALALCRRCPVAADCLAWAVASDCGSGVWGGSTEEQRAAARPRSRRARTA
ncbi:transcription factor WhiB [Motilibacter rhizosphaerae]|uniref:Transcription factor WhiB n=1 Tax=Motilibacter rhizosphaerae TaxID=598652 RepID=A0A4Q7NQ26_9ACTN|nr:WhiB family transcriptional regulator [Motilibacter rhizosphaerae]RZS87389.1 transcription factor WhiB [Motilibacter rhizosphaerae]